MGHRRAKSVLDKQTATPSQGTSGAHQGTEYALIQWGTMGTIWKGLDSKVSVGKRKSIMDGIWEKRLGVVYNSKCSTEARWIAAAAMVPAPDMRQTWETDSIAEASSLAGDETDKEAEKPMSLANLNHDSAMVGPRFPGERADPNLAGGTESCSMNKMTSLVVQGLRFHLQMQGS